MHSMTGFGRAVASDDGRALTIELRSVNHRFLDLSFRLPRGMQQLEPVLRAMAQARLGRGHVDISLFEQRLSPLSPKVVVDTALAGAYLRAAGELAKASGIKGKLKLARLMQLPDVMKLTEPEENEEALQALAEDAMAKALDVLVESRRREGEATALDMRGQLQELQGIADAMTALVPEQLHGYADRLKARVQTLAAEGLEPQRLAQEIALMADKVAVDEELARLKAHIDEAHACLAGEGPQGRKLDFLAQELGREVNTIASKANLLALTQQALAAKNCVEKLREQAQNLE